MLASSSSKRPLAALAVSSAGPLLGRAPAKRACKQWPCPHCDAVITHESRGNLSRHIKTAHADKCVRCLICNGVYIDNAELKKHAIECVTEAHCAAVDWTAFRPDPAAVAPTSSAVLTGLQDYARWLGEEPTDEERELGVRRKAVTREQTIDTVLGVVLIIASIAHELFPGIWAAGFRPAVLVDAKVAQAVIARFAQRTGRSGASTTVVGASRMSDVTGALKKLCAYLARRMRDATRVEFQFKHCGAWTLVRGKGKAYADERLEDRSFRQTPAGKVLHQQATMTPEELLRVGRTCVERLVAWEATPKPDAGYRPGFRRDYLAHLITALLVYALGPRPQCLQQLTLADTFSTGMRERPRIPSVFAPGDPLNSSTSDYLLQLPASAVKNHAPWFVWLPAFMTRHLDFWRAQFTKPDDAWLFLSENGKQQRDGAARWTTKVTQSIIGRPIIAHRFRHAVVTFFDAQNLSADEKQYLRQFMMHTDSTAQQHYRDDRVMARVCWERLLALFQ